MGILHGLAPTDITFLRYGVAGIVTAPVLIYHLMQERTNFLECRYVWLGISLLAGPLFSLTLFTAFQLAPESHAAIFPASAMSVMGTLLAVPLLAHQLTARKINGMVMAALGLLILWQFSPHPIDSRSLAGDLLLIVSGTMWAGFLVIVNRYKLDAMLATAVVSFVALITYVPIYLFVTGASNLRAAAPSVAWIEAVIQGGLAGAGAIFAYAKAAQILGASRAAIFPALAPAFATLFSWPVLGSIPGPVDAVGLLIAMAGLIVSVTESPRSKARAAEKPLPER